MKTIETIKNNTQKEREIDNKIETYFFDPHKIRYEYIEVYKKNHRKRYKNEGRYRYSPLYYLRREILFLLARIPYIKDCVDSKKVEFYPVLTSYITIDIAIQGLMVDIYGLNRSLLVQRTKDYCKNCNCESCVRNNLINETIQKEKNELDSLVRKFLIEFMGVEKKQASLLKKLRNTLVHNFYKLIDRNEKGEKINYLVSDFQPKNNLIIKYNKKEVENTGGEKYIIHEYKVYPLNYFELFGRGVSELKNKIQEKNSEERDTFDANIDLDTWITILDI